MGNNKDNPKVSPLTWVLLGCYVIFFVYLYYHQELLYTSPPYVAIVVFGYTWISEIYSAIRDSIKLFREWQSTPKESGKFRRLLRGNRAIIVTHLLRIAMIAIMTFILYDLYAWREQYLLSSH